MKPNKTKIYLLLLMIIALGFFLRIWNINEAPPGIYPDEAVNGEDALRAIHEGTWAWFYSANQGREGLFMNIIAILFKFFGVSALTLKLPSIIFGTFTIWGTYLLSKELFQKDRLALIASFLTAVSFWAINFSRISFRANMLPFVLVFSFYFLWKGLRTQKFRDFAFGGLVFGIGLHTYIAFRIAPLVLVFTLLFLIWNRKKFLKNYWRHILVFIFFFLVSAFPMLYTFLVSHPEYLSSRSASVSILSPEINQGDFWGTLGKTLSLSLAKYNFWGDQNWRHNYPPYPILDPLTGIGFLLGIISFIVAFFIKIKRRLSEKESSDRLVISVFLLSWFFLLLAPEFMTDEGLPHALRAIGTLPVVMIFSAFIFNYFMEKSDRHSPIYRKSVLLLFFLMAVFIAGFNSLKYHLFWANQKETAQAFEKKLIDISDYVRSLPEMKEKFIITGSMQRIPIKILNYQKPYLSYLYPGEIDQLQPQNPNYFEIIMTDKDDFLIQKIISRFPELALEERTDRFGLSFFVLK
ncbi:MAG: ArnT family glycosyltransferase [Patescibacteria group bacterium]